MIDKSLVNKIFLACQDNNVEYLKTRDVEDIKKVVDDHGAGCVHYSVRGGNTTGIDSLVYLVQDCSVSIKQPSKVGALPLHDACAKGNLEAVTWLLSNGDSGLEDGDISGTLPIHLAAGFGNLEIVELLVKEYNASLNVKTKNGARPLHFAAASGHIHVVQFITEWSKSHIDSIVNVQMASGATPVYLASQEGHFRTVQYLVKEGKASTKILTYDGMSCLHTAAQNGHLPVVQWMANDQRLNINAKEIDGGMTALHFAVGCGRINMTNWLLKNGAKITLDFVGGTPLHNAAHYGYEECGKLLLDNGCDPDLLDNDGCSAIDIAAMSGQYGYAGFITRWKKQKSSEEERLKNLAAIVVENMRRKIPAHLRIPTASELTKGQNDEDDDDYERPMNLEDMINIPPPPSYPPPAVPTPPAEHRVIKQDRIDEDESTNDKDVKPNRFKIIAQMKKSSIEKRSTPSPDKSRSGSSTPDNSEPPSRTNSFKAIAKFKQASIERRNGSSDRSIDASADSPAQSNNNGATRTNSFKNLPKFRRTSMKKRESTEKYNTNTPKASDDESPAHTNRFRAIAKIKQASIERRSQSSGDKSNDEGSRASSPLLESQEIEANNTRENESPTRPNRFRAIAKFKQASIENRSQSSADKSNDEDSRGSSPVDEGREPRRTNSFKAIAKFKKASAARRNQSPSDQASDNESLTHKDISPKEIQRIKKEEAGIANNNNKGKGPMVRQNSFTVVAKMKMTALQRSSTEKSLEEEGREANGQNVNDSENQQEEISAESTPTNENCTKDPVSDAGQNIVLTKFGGLPTSKNDGEGDESKLGQISPNNKLTNELQGGSKNQRNTHQSNNKPINRNYGNSPINNTNGINDNNGNINPPKQVPDKADVNSNKPTRPVSRSSITRKWPPASAEDNTQDDTSHSSDNGNLIVAELKDADVRSSLRKTKKVTKGQSKIFFGASTTPASQNNSQTSQQRPSSTVLVGEFDPKNFLDQVPTIDTSGNELPPWKRMLMAKQVAEKAFTDRVEQRRKDEQEAKLRDMPVWKREILRKKEEERMAVQVQ